MEVRKSFVEEVILEQVLKSKQGFIQRARMGKGIPGRRSLVGHGADV